MSRIPAYNSHDPDGMVRWFGEMAARGLLFHPEDDPARIVRIADGSRTFSGAEAATIRDLMARMQYEHGYEQMLDACYPIFMRAAGQRLDA